MGTSSRANQPDDGTERAVMLGWLAFHRDALHANCAGLDAAQLANHATPPSQLSLLGLVRHLTETERVYAVYALGPKSDLQMVWGEYTESGPEWDFEADESMVADSMSAWAREKQAADERIGHHTSTASIGSGDGRSLRWNLHKLIGEYARHNGHADLLRESIDGSTGE